MRRYLVNGVELAVEVTGTGPALLFIHGYPFDHSIWSHSLAHLSGVRRIAPDLRGFGSSGAPATGSSMGAYAADLAGLLDVLETEKAVICGLSMGGYVAFEFLRAFRSRVAGLVLVATRALADSPEGKQARDAAIAAARTGGAASVAEAMLPKVLGPAGLNDASLVSTVRRMIERNPIAGLVGALTAMRDRPDSTPLLGGLGDIPTLVVAGDADRIIPLAEISGMRDAIPGSHWRMIPGSGHLISMERPGMFTEALQGFVDSTLKP
jgi:pimeloyl-ACP methyl ester carboxylesterase